MMCEVRYIYALYFRGRVVYIGQTYNIKKRISQHKHNFIYGVDKSIYNFLRRHTNDFNEVVIKPLKVCPKRDVDLYEKRYIKHCLKNGRRIMNDCVYSNAIRVDLGIDLIS